MLKIRCNHPLIWKQQTAETPFFNFVTAFKRKWTKNRFHVSLCTTYLYTKWNDHRFMISKRTSKQINRRSSGKTLLLLNYLLIKIIIDNHNFHSARLFRNFKVRQEWWRQRSVKGIRGSCRFRNLSGSNGVFQWIFPIYLKIWEPKALKKTITRITWLRCTNLMSF